MKVSLRANLWAIVFAIVFPSIVTLLYFVVLTGPIAQLTYAVLKVVQFAFPALWVFAVVRKKFKWAGPTPKGVGLGLAFGFLVGGAMLALALLVLKPMGFFDGPQVEIIKKIQDMGLATLPKYAAAGVFYALFHSFLEEYYWRWFVFKRLRPYTTLAKAIAVSSLGFMAHHVIVLGIYFGWASPATYLFSLSVAIGGAVWAWIYERTDSLYGPWLSHMVVDAAIFLVGYNLAFQAGSLILPG